MGDKGKEKMTEEDLEDEKRNEKGKEKMSAEQLEEEERKEAERKARGLKMEKLKNVFKYLSKTKLAKIVSGIVPSGLANLEKFSWRYPKQYGITLWESGETSSQATQRTTEPQEILRSSSSRIVTSSQRTQYRRASTSTPRSNPLPVRQCQYGEPHCMAYAVYHLLMTQAAIISRYANINCPLISLSYLVRLVSRLPPLTTMLKFVEHLDENGVFRAADYDKTNGKPTLSIEEYGVFGPKDLTLEEFGLAICKAVSLFGGVLLSIPSINADGTRSSTKTSVTNKDGTHEFIEVFVGHALCCIGWKTRIDGVFQFICIDSREGATKGFWVVDLWDMNSISMVYVLQLECWF